MSLKALLKSLLGGEEILECTFHNVGHGLFYTGILWNKLNKLKFYKAKSYKATFVYDCGSISLCPSELGNRINEFLNKLHRLKCNHKEESVIDLLIISHFHADHINGLPMLLEKVTQVRNVVMPYLSFLERILIATVNLVNFKVFDQRYFEFLYDPITYLLENYSDKIGRIILIGRSPEGPPSDGGDFQIPEAPLDFNPENPLDIENLGDGRGNEALKQKIMSEVPSWNRFLASDEPPLTVKTHNGYAILLGSLFFRFFNLKYSFPDLDKKLNCFENCIKGIWGVTDLRNVSKEEVICELRRKRNNKFRKCYENCFGKKNLNLTSLACLHIPLIKKSDEFLVFHCGNEEFSFLDINKSMAYMLTGDLLFNKRKYIQEFQTHFKSLLKDIFIFQVPHHGSRYNWNNNLLSLLNNALLLPISVSYKGKHPHKEVILDILDHNRIPIIVNECRNFQCELRKIDKDLIAMLFI